MKDFLGTFILSFIIVMLFFVFGGYLIFENIWMIIFLSSFIITLLIRVFIRQETRIENMEERIKKLECKK